MVAGQRGQSKSCRPSTSHGLVALHRPWGLFRRCYIRIIGSAWRWKLKQSAISVYSLETTLWVVRKLFPFLREKAFVKNRNYIINCLINCIINYWTHSVYIAARIIICNKIHVISHSLRYVWLSSTRCLFILITELWVPGSWKEKLLADFYLHVLFAFPACRISRCREYSKFSVALDCVTLSSSMITTEYVDVYFLYALSCFNIYHALWKWPIVVWLEALALNVGLLPDTESSCPTGI